METKLPEFLREYFWDVNFDELEADKHWFLITKRVLDRGSTGPVRWLINQYGQGKIKEVVQTTRDLDVKTANFWADMLGLNKNKVPCLNKPYSPIHFGLYS